MKFGLIPLQVNNRSSFNKDEKMVLSSDEINTFSRDLYIKHILEYIYYMDLRFNIKQNFIHKSLKRGIK